MESKYVCLRATNKTSAEFPFGAFFIKDDVDLEERLNKQQLLVDDRVYEVTGQRLIIVARSPLTTEDDDRVL